MPNSYSYSRVYERQAELHMQHKDFRGAADLFSKSIRCSTGPKRIGQLASKMLDAVLALHR